MTNLKIVTAAEFLKSKGIFTEGQKYLLDCENEVNFEWTELLDEYARLCCSELNELLDIQIQAYLESGTNKEELLNLLKKNMIYGTKFKN